VDIDEVLIGVNFNLGIWGEPQPTFQKLTSKADCEVNNRKVPMKRYALHTLSQHSPVSRQYKAEPGDLGDGGQFG
jgi:hypothetical protein